MVFHWSLTDNKSFHVSNILLGILSILNNAAVWMISNRPPTSKSASLFNTPLLTVLKALITIGIIVTFLFHRFFNPPLLLSLLLLLLWLHMYYF